MVIKILSENTAISPDYLTEHGLSVYIESDKTILFDTGASNNFVINAKTMGVDLSAVDYAALSHGHYDHGDGINAFFEVNSKAKIYINSKAFEQKYSISEKVKKYIGIDETLQNHARVILNNKDIYKINDSNILFRTLKTCEGVPIGNSALFCKTEDGLALDKFEDEQSLLVIEKGKTFLFAGCAHRGILNIIEQSKQILNKYPDYVVGGFHLHSKSDKYCESLSAIERLANKLKQLDINYITCHCTGVEEYGYLKKTLKGRIRYASCGEIITL